MSVSSKSLKSSRSSNSNYSNNSRSDNESPSLMGSDRDYVELPGQPILIQAIVSPKGAQNHTYSDFSKIPATPDYRMPTDIRLMSFSEKVHHMLSQPEHVMDVSWMPHGRAFKIHRPAFFEKHVCPKYFGHGRYSSFLRQLNDHGFKHLTKGADRNAYYHQYMLRGRPHLCRYMPAVKTARRIVADPDHEPNFYRISQMYPLEDENPTQEQVQTQEPKPNKKEQAQVPNNKAQPKSVSPNTVSPNTTPASPTGAAAVKKTTTTTVLPNFAPPLTTTQYQPSLLSELLASSTRLPVPTTALLQALHRHQNTTSDFLEQNAQSLLIAALREASSQTTTTAFRAHPSAVPDLSSLLGHCPVQQQHRQPSPRLLRHNTIVALPPPPRFQVMQPHVIQPPPQQQQPEYNDNDASSSANLVRLALAMRLAGRQDM